MIRDAAGLRRYIEAIAKDLRTRGFDVPLVIDAEIDDAGFAAFSITGRIPDDATSVETEAIVAEIWRPLGGSHWERVEYTYDLIDRPAGRRRGWHLHDRDWSRAVLGVAAHEHCEERPGEPDCDHYRGVELADAHQGIALLDGAWVSPDALGCESLECLEAL